MAELGKDAIEMMHRYMTQGEISKSHKLAENIIARIEKRKKVKKEKKP